MKTLTKTLALSLAMAIAATSSFADDALLGSSVASDLITDVFFSGNPENSYIFLGGTSYSLDSTSNNNSKGMKQLKEAIVRDADAYALSGEMGIILGTAVKNVKNQNPELSDEEAINYLLELI